MPRLHSIVVAGSLSLMTLACAVVPSQDVASPSSEATSGAATADETSRVEGWWELGDSAGVFTAELRGDDVVSVERELSHGEYGATRDRFDFESGALIRYSQDSQLRLMDPDDPSRLVPVWMRLEFGSSGELAGGEKTVDGTGRDIEPADVDRVLAQVETLLERARSFADVAASTGETVRFACSDERSFAVTFADEAALLDLGPGWGRHVLSRQPSASGAKYGDDAFMFWTKGDEAMVERFGESFLSDCRVVD